MNNLTSSAARRKAGRCATTVLAGLCAAVFLCSSCKKEENVSRQNGNIILNMPGASRALSDHVQIYLFNGENNANRGRFNRKIYQIERNDNLLTAQEVPAGTWDIALVTTADGSGMNQIIDPVGGSMRDDAVMFKLEPSGGVWPGVPEIMTGRVNGQSVLVGVSNSVAGVTSLARNVAKVTVTIRDPKGYDPAGLHKLTLGNIPTTLDWEGGLHPGRTNPSTTGAGAGMTGNFTITDLGGGSQKCDTLEFIVPAHRGSDFMNANPADTTTCKLDISVNLAMSSGGSYEKGPVTIPIVPKANKILEVTLVPTEAKIDVLFNVAPWNYKQSQIIFE
jgi:hypothetical protein